MRRPATARWRVALGIALGLAGAAVVMPLLEGRAPWGHEVPDGTIQSDCDGRLAELVVHYAAGAGPVAGDTYRDFLGALPGDVTVHVVCPDAAAMDELRRLVGSTRCTLWPVVVGHPVTCWSRDRWLALRPDPRADRAAAPRAVLLCPREEDGAEVWPARAGDQRAADGLRAALGPGVASRRSELFFDGGDFVCDDQTAFVAPSVRLRNIQRTVADEEELVRRLEAALGKRVVLLGDAPPHHAGMFMMAAGGRTVLVSDPAAARPVLDAMPPGAIDALDLPGGADFTPDAQAQFDAVAEQCRAAGYRVVRVPTVPAADHRTYLTYVNVVIDERAGRRVVWMPVYAGVEPLNAAAESVWRELGFEVRRVRCDGCFRHFGTLRCLVSVMVRLADDPGRSS